MLCLDSMDVIKRKHRPHVHFNFPDTLNKHLPVQIGRLNAQPLSADGKDVMMGCVSLVTNFSSMISLKSEHLLLHRSEGFSLHPSQ